MRGVRSSSNWSEVSLLLSASVEITGAFSLGYESINSDYKRSLFIVNKHLYLLKTFNNLNLNYISVLCDKCRKL